MKYIDNVQFAKNKQYTCATIAIDSLSRAHEIFEELGGEIQYEISGHLDDKKMPVLKIKICGKITTLCQNCLENLDIPIEYIHEVPIFYTESDMDNALFGSEDTQYTDGVLADPNFSIDNFIEDELIMLLPMVPRHNKCQTKAYHDKPDSPFRVLVN